MDAFDVLSTLERGEDVASVNAELQALFRRSVQPLLRSVLAVDPAMELSALRMPVLIVSGGRDLQVGPKDARLLTKARPDAARFNFAEMNHVLKIASADVDGQRDLYSNPSVPLAPVLSKAVAAFIEEIATSSRR